MFPPETPFSNDKNLAHTLAKEIKEAQVPITKDTGKPWPFHTRDLSKNLEIYTQDMNRLTHTDTAMIMSNMLSALVPVIAAIESMEALIHANKDAMQTNNRDVSIGETPAEVREASVILGKILCSNYPKIQAASNRFGDLVQHYNNIERHAVLNAHVKSTFRIFGD